MEVLGFNFQKKSRNKEFWEIESKKNKKLRAKGDNFQKS